MEHGFQYNDPATGLAVNINYQKGECDIHVEFPKENPIDDKSNKCDVLAFSTFGEKSVFGGIVVASVFVPAKSVDSLKEIGVKNPDDLSEDDMFRIIRSLYTGGNPIDFQDHVTYSVPDGLPDAYVIESAKPYTCATIHLVNPTDIDKYFNKYLREDGACDLVSVIDNMHHISAYTILDFVGEGCKLNSYLEVNVDAINDMTPETFEKLSYTVENACDIALDTYFGDIPDPRYDNGYYDYRIRVGKQLCGDLTAIYLARILARVTFSTHLTDLSNKVGFKLSGSNNGVSKTVRRILQSGKDIQQVSKWCMLFPD